MRGLNEAALMDLVMRARSATGLSLFGVDVIVEQGTKSLFCVDVNYFPAYKEVPDVHERVLALLQRSSKEKAEQI